MKTALIIIGVVLILAIGGGAYWLMSRPQVITFSDDESRRACWRSCDFIHNDQRHARALGAAAIRTSAISLFSILHLRRKRNGLRFGLWRLRRQPQRK